jgi:hypothetical protein
MWRRIAYIANSHVLHFIILILILVKFGMNSEKPFNSFLNQKNLHNRGD